MKKQEVEVKMKMGNVLVKLKSNHYIRNLNNNEQNIAKILVSKEILRYVGPGDCPQILIGEQIAIYHSAVANAKYEILGKGHLLLEKYSESELTKGRFLLPGELKWYECPPYKYIWEALANCMVPAIVAFVVSFFTNGCLDKNYGKSNSNTPLTNNQSAPPGLGLNQQEKPVSPS